MHSCLSSSVLCNVLITICFLSFFFFILSFDREGRKERKRDTEPTEAAARKNRSFGGQGNRLGTGEEPEVPNEPSPIPEASSSPAGDSDVEMEEVNYTLTFWEDGFSVDDGPLRDYKDPANEQFLKTLREG